MRDKSANIDGDMEMPIFSVQLVRKHEANVNIVVIKYQNSIATALSRDMLRQGFPTYRLRKCSVPMLIIEEI